jgi:hypothetical protein
MQTLMTIPLARKSEEEVYTTKRIFPLQNPPVLKCG